MRMDIQVPLTTLLTSTTFISATTHKSYTSSSSSSSSYNRSTTNPICSTRKSQDPGDQDEAKGGSGGKSSTNWDKAWSSFKKQGKKKSMLSQFSPNKYVTWNPRPSNYPLSEEVDPIRRAERSNLRLWTGPGFTLAGAIVIVSFLLIYTILAPIK